MLLTLPSSSRLTKGTIAECLSNKLKHRKATTVTKADRDNVDNQSAGVTVRTFIKQDQTQSNRSLL